LMINISFPLLYGGGIFPVSLFLGYFFSRKERINWRGLCSLILLHRVRKGPVLFFFRFSVWEANIFLLPYSPRVFFPFQPSLCSELETIPPPPHHLVDRAALTPSETTLPKLSYRSSSTPVARTFLHFFCPDDDRTPLFPPLFLFPC